MSSKHKDLDIGAVIVTKEKQMWMNIRDGLEKEGMELKGQLEMNKALLPFVEKKIKELE